MTFKNSNMAAKLRGSKATRKTSTGSKAYPDYKVANMAIRHVYHDDPMKALSIESLPAFMVGESLVMVDVVEKPSVNKKGFLIYLHFPAQALKFFRIEKTILKAERTEWSAYDRLTIPGDPLSRITAM